MSNLRRREIKKEIQSLRILLGSLKRSKEVTVGTIVDISTDDHRPFNVFDSLFYEKAVTFQGECIDIVESKIEEFENKLQDL